MADEELKRESGEETSEGTIDYISAINELKKNTVPKSEYAKLKEENKRLLDNVINGTELPEEMKSRQEEPKADIAALREELYGGKKELSNLEYMEKTLELRDALMANGEPDPFVANGVKIDNPPTRETYERAQELADIYRECIEYAQGDSALFTQELQRRTVDTAPLAQRQNSFRR